MKTNLTDLMQRISTLEKEILILHHYLDSDSYNCNTKVIELNGTEQILSENDDFNEMYEKYNLLGEKINNLKQIVQKKNNEIETQIKNDKTGEYLTIGDALILVRALRQKLNLLESLSNKHETKRRVTETTNSYFEVVTPAYDVKDIQNQRDEVKDLIQNLEREIVKANSETLIIEDSLY